MRNFSFFLALFPLALFTNIALAQNASPHIQSRLEEVTIYRQGAEIKRTAEAELAPGNNDIIIDGLSNFIDEKSINLSTDENVTILSVAYKVDPKKIKQKGGVWHTLADSLDSLQMRYDFFKNEHYALEQEMQLLQENRKIAIPEKGIYVDDLEEAADFYRSRTIEIKNKTTQLNDKEKYYQELINEVQQELKDASDLHTIAVGELIIKLNSTSYTKATLNLSYQTAKAGWKPAYNLRMEGDKAQLQLDYDALVRQETAEDWKNAKINLATAMLKPQMVRPELGNWYISVEEDNRKWGLNDSTDDLQDALPDTFSDLASDRPNVTIPLNLRYTLISDAKVQRLAVKQFALPASFHYFALPMLSENAFLVSEVTGWSDFNMLPGEAGLFKGNTYVGKTLLDPRLDSDTLTLIFNKDKDISLGKLKMKDISKKAFIGGSVKEDFEYAINIKNNKEEAVKLVMEEHIPIPRSKELEVKLENPGGAQYDAPSGKLRWEIDLQPGESKVIQYGFSVKYPKGRRINNLY